MCLCLYVIHATWLGDRSYVWCHMKELCVGLDVLFSHYIFFSSPSKVVDCDTKIMSSILYILFFDNFFFLVVSDSIEHSCISHKQKLSLAGFACRLSFVLFAAVGITYSVCFANRNYLEQFFSETEPVLLTDTI